MAGGFRIAITAQRQPYRQPPPPPPLPVAAEPIVRSYLQCGQAIPEDWTNRFVVAYQEELQYWVDYLQGKTDVPGPGAEDGYEACKISDALIKAQTTGQWEKVEA